jgi:hypothetical protein
MSKLYLTALIFAGAITVLWIGWVLWTAARLIALTPTPSLVSTALVVLAPLAASTAFPQKSEASRILTTSKTSHDQLQ